MTKKGNREYIIMVYAGSVISFESKKMAKKIEESDIIAGSSHTTN